METKISVLMPVYNGEKYLKKAIESILGQTLTQFEFIIIDDGSLDGTEEIVRSFTDPRIKYFKKHNSGIADSLNFGLKQCVGEFVARMDCDDLAEEDRLLRQFEFLDENLEYVMCGSRVTVIDQTDNIVDDYLLYQPITHSEIKKYMIKHNPFFHSSVMMRKKVFENIGPYKKAYKSFGEDYELWTRIIFQGKVKNLEGRLLRYRLNAVGTTQKNKMKMRKNGIIIRVIYILRLLKHDNLFSTIWYKK